jgi:hypothetical protein
MVWCLAFRSSPHWGKLFEVYFPLCSSARPRPYSCGRGTEWGLERLAFGRGQLDRQLCEECFDHSWAADMLSVTALSRRAFQMLFG